VIKFKEVVPFMEYTTKKRFCECEFRRMQVWRNQKVGIREIARRLERSPSSVSRQLRKVENLDEKWRWKKWEKYFSADFAIENQRKNCRKRGAKSKILKCPELKEFLEVKIKKKWSPRMAIGYARKNNLFDTSVSVKTVYNSIYRRELDISLFDLALKLRRKPQKEHRIRQWKKNLGKKIDERPDISSREEFGHWEIDTVLWGHKCSVLTMVERKTRYCKLLKLDSHTSEEVNKRFKEAKIAMKTLTTDNGVEFSRLGEVFKDTYYTHPYSSYEKGSIENLNGIIRRYIPRSANPLRITQKLLSRVEEAINELPRPSLDYSTAKELYLSNTV
jgi:IS30 family transposase